MNRLSESLAGIISFVLLLTLALGSAFPRAFGTTQPKPLIDDRGALLLLIDPSMVLPLNSELQQLELDLTGDGWEVIRHNAVRSNVGAVTDFVSNRSVDSQIHAVKNLIKSEYELQPERLKAVYLFGHIPMPLAGCLSPDDHEPRARPVVADQFYGELNGSWTDGENIRCNHPGDGVFDQDIYIPSLLQPGTSLYMHRWNDGDLELQVGRVDLWNLPEFPLSETELLRQYLRKLHNYRHKITTARNEVFFENRIAGNRDLPLGPLSRLDPEVEVCYPNSSHTNCSLKASASSNTYNFAFAGAGSTNISLRHSDYLAGDPKVNFLWLNGSYTYDWRENAASVRSTHDITMRSPLAGGENYGLAVFWGIQWDFPGLNEGRSIGYAAKRIFESFGMQYSYTGDPTLRLHVVSPPGMLSAVQNGNSVVLNWNASPESGVLGYHVYRKIAPARRFSRLTGEPTGLTSFIDQAPPPGLKTYMVRAVKIQDTPQGPYYNASQGIFSSVTQADCTGRQGGRGC